MGFFNALSSIRSNKQNFKEWEQKQNDTEAQRAAYFKDNQPSKDELELAKLKGKTIIDVLNRMDGHSEDVAEKTEFALELPVALTPVIATIGAGLLSSLGINKLDKQHTEILNKFLEENGTRIDELINTVTKELPDKYSINRESIYTATSKKLSKKNLSNGLKKEILEVAEKYKKATKGIKNKEALLAVLPIGVLVTSFIGIILWATKVQVGSSRVARWQSREQLKDTRNFIQYTQDEIQEAEKNAEANLEKTDHKKGILSRIKKEEKASLIKVMRDKKEYEKWKQSDTSEPEKITRPLSKEELEKAKKDQEVIQRITKTVNNKAEEYSEDMETAAESLINGTPYLTGAVGAIVGKIISLTGIFKKGSDKAVSNFIQEAQLDDEAKEFIKNTAKKFTDKKQKVSALEQARFIQTINNATFINKKTQISELLSKGKTIAKTMPKAFNIAVGLATGTVAGIIGSYIGMKLQKSAARAGRFVAKQELMNNPENFIGLTEEELKAQKDIKAEKKSFGQKTKEYITFLPRVLKQYFEYEKYKKEELPKQKAIQEELMKIEVSNERLKEAENLQRKLFNTFEKVDDKSQDYSESVEAVTTIAQPAIGIAGFAALIAPIVTILTMIGTGKISGKTVTKKVSNFLANHTGFLKGKLMTRYFNQVSENAGKVIPEYVKKISDEDLKKLIMKNIPEGVEIDPNEIIKQYKSAMAILNLTNVNISDGTKVMKSLVKQLNSLRGNNGDNVKIANALLENLKAIAEKQDGKLTEKDIQAIISTMTNGNEKLTGILTKAIKESLGTEIDISSMGNTIDEMRKLLEKADKIPNFTDVSWIRKFAQNKNNGLTSIINGMTDEELTKTMENIQKIAKNVPTEKLAEVADAFFEQIKKNPNSIAVLSDNKALAQIFLTKDMAIIGGTLTATHAGLNLLSVYLLETYFANLQKKAGRLGVMEAIKELEDPAYYANKEKIEKADTKIDNSKQINIASKGTSPFLKDMLKNKQ